MIIFLTGIMTLPRYRMSRETLPPPAVTASALLELSGYGDKKQGEEYFRYAENILKQLSSEEYLAKEGENHGFILLHSVGSFPHDSEIDTPLNYADYYYLEALKRYKDLKEKSDN